MGFIINPYLFVSSTPPAEAFENYYSNEFDGVDDYVDLGTNVLFDSTSAFSVSGWVKLTSYSPSYPAMILLKTDQATGFQIGFSDVAGYQGVWFGSDSNFLRLSTLDATLASTLINGSWHHIVLTYDGVSRTTASSYTLYVDGSSKSLGAASAYASVPNENRIGKGSTSTTVVNGSIDEVGIWDVALDSDAVTALYNSGSPISLSSDSGDYDNSSSLQGWWRMGDGANYPLIKNQAHFSQTALEFDGSNDYVTMGNVSSLDFSNSDAFSISAWVKLATVSSTHKMIVSKMDETTDYRGYNIRSYNGAVKVSLSNDAGTNELQFTSTANPLTTAWHHVVFTYDGSSASSGCTVYVDGSVEAGSWTGTLSATISNSAPFNIGARNNGSLPFNGEIDDVLVTNTELSSSDVTDIYNSGYPKDESERSGLVAYYKFDGDTYPVVQDALQFSNASLDFDGSNDYIVVPNTSDFDYGTGDFCWSFWINYTTHKNYSGILETGSSNSEYRLKFQTSGQYLFMQNADGDSQVADLGTNITGTGWHHILLNRVSGTIYTYLDGTQVDSDVRSGNVNSNGQDLNIGYNGAAYTHTGNFSNMALWKGTSLSASDIATVYNSGKPSDISALNPTNWWKLGDGTINPNTPSALGYGTHSVEFDGVDDYVDIGAMSSIHSQSAITVSAWINPASLGDFEGIVSQRQSTSDFTPAIELLLGGSGAGANTGLFVRINDTSDGYGYTASSLLSTGTWYHVAMVFDGSLTGNANRLKLYLNGVQKTLTFGGTIPATTPTPATNMVIGKQIHGSGEYFNGNIKQIAVFDAELSSSDVTALYNNGLPKDISSESGLVSYYRMGDGEDKYPNILDYKGTNHGTMTNMASDDITTANVGSGTMTNMASDDIVADSPSGTSGQMTNMASDDFVAAKDAGTMTNMTAEDIVADVPKAFVDVDFLVVAGGGAGGQANVLGHVAGGGGGAGGLRTSYGSNSGGGSSAESAFSAEIGTSYTVTVGAGGAAQSSSSEFVGNPGNNSVFATITSIGGGGGGGNNLNATTGGSGGGGSESDGAGAAGTANQGYAGGTGSESGNRGGGGGGAGAVGGTTDGGVGLSVSITGSAVFYAGGGASSGTGGNGGGGNNRTDGTPNTGGGGGSDQTDNPDAVGAGGSGIVILRYPNTRTITVGSGLTSSTTTDGSDKVTTFTAGTDTVSFS